MLRAFVVKGQGFLRSWRLAGVFIFLLKFLQKKGRLMRLRDGERGLGVNG